MSNDETYNGWANRETWAFNLHWQNDQGLYADVLEYAGEQLTDSTVSDRHLGELVVEYMDERTDLAYWRDDVGAPVPEWAWLMRSDVGSFWRIDREEVGAAVREALANEER